MKAKKSLAMILAIALLSTIITVSAFAKEPVLTTKLAIDKMPVSETVAEIDAVLVERGYPQIVLDAMSNPEKRAIYKDENLYFKGATIMLYDQESGSFEEYEVCDDGLMPMGQISSSDLSLVWTISGVRNNDRLIDIKYSYKWLNLPFFRWQDPIAVSWDGDLFEMQDDSFYKVDYYDGEYVESAGVIAKVTEGIHSEEYGYASGSPIGVTWYADLKGYGDITVKKLYGYGEFVLEKTTSATGSSKIYGRYVHPTSGISLSIGISDYGSFSVSGGSGYDERGTQTTFKY